MNTQKQHFTMAFIVVLTCSLIVPAVFAQTPNYNIGDAVKQAVPPPKEPPMNATETPVIVQEESEKLFSMREGEKLPVKDFKIEGAEQADEAKLAELLAPSRNKALTMSEITEVANKLTLFYRNKGCLLAKAYVPKQDARGGILTLRIIMGSYGKVSVKNASLVRNAIVQGVFDRVKDSSTVVRKDKLERAMLLVKEMPGGNLPTVAIAAGETPGTSDFVVNVDRAHRFNGYTMANNQGSHYTGENRIYGGVDINSPFGIADKLSFSYMTTDEIGLQNYRLSYGFPLASNGLRAEVSASRTTYELSGIYSILNATGYAHTFEGAISYPVKKSNGEIIDVSLNVAFKKLQDDLSAVGTKNPRNAFVATLATQRGAAGSIFGHSLYTNISGSVAGGRLDIRDKDQLILNKAGANTDGAFAKLNFGFSGNLELAKNLSFKASVKLQHILTERNVDTTEQFFLSGSDGVRAYSESIGFDNGYVANGELRYSLPGLRGFKHAVSLFADNGSVTAHKGDYIAIDHIRLTDAGAGYYAGFRQFFGSVQVARPIGNDRSVEDPGTRVLFQAGMAF